MSPRITGHMTNASMVGNFIGLSEYATTIHSYCNADAGSAWDLVDDDYGGYIDVTALPKAEYWKKLEESIPEGYTKDNGIFGTNYNSKVALVGVVDFDKDTLAALIYYPDERTNNYVQDCDSLDVSEGKMLLIPIHKDFQVAVYADFPEGRQEIYRASAEDKLAWDQGLRPAAGLRLLVAGREGPHHSTAGAGWKNGGVCP